MSKKAIAAVDRGEASFAEWFEAQYGERPYAESVSDLCEAVNGAEARAVAFRYKLQTTIDWERARDAALKAWQAARRQKRVPEERVDSEKFATPMDRAVGRDKL